jgi:glycosyltransferase involved in cell wall biosynthesis
VTFWKSHQGGKRVLMLLENSHYPGDTRVYNEARALRDAGYQVSVIAQRKTGSDSPYHQVIDDVQVYRFPLLAEGSGFLSYISEYGLAMAEMFLLSLVVLVRHGFDIIHAANPPDLFFLLVAPFKLLGKRFVFDHHDLSPELYDVREGGKGHPIVRGALLAMERLSCRMADLVIATNESYKAIEMARDGVPESRIVVVRNGPDLDDFKPVEPAPGLAQEGKPLIVYMGVIAVQDGVDYLLRALDCLVHELRLDDFHCVVIGDGTALPALRVMAERLGLSDYVHFTGWVQRADIPSYLSAADICVAPEPSNALNDHSTIVKVMEYMALGKPIVAFDLPEHRYSAGAGAVYAQPNEELDFARQIAALLADAGLRQKIGRAGRARVEANLAWAQQAKALVEAYGRLTARAATGRPASGLNTNLGVDDQ